MATSCPRCNERADLTVFSATLLRTWIHCQRCGHVWCRSTIAHWTARLLGAPRLPSEWNQPSHTEPLLARARCEPREDSDFSTQQLEAWLRCDADRELDTIPNKAVDRWLDSEPSVPAPCTQILQPRTLTERLDALIEGLHRLEGFVANYNRLERAAAKPAPDTSADAAPAYSRTKVLRFRAS